MSEKVTKKDLADALSEKNGMTKKAAADAVNTVFDAILNHLSSGQDVSVHGFGTFKTKTRSARTGRNPQTGESVSIPEKTVASFKPAPAAAKLINA